LGPAFNVASGWNWGLPPFVGGEPQVGREPDGSGGFFHVYVLTPLGGAALASQFFVRVLEPQAEERIQT